MKQGIPARVVYEILNRLDYTAILFSGEGDVFFANTPFLDFYNIQAQQIVGQKVYKPELGIVEEKHWRDTIQRTKDNGGMLKYEQQRLLNGKSRCVATTLILFDINGQECMLYMSEDITEKREIQQQAEELNQMLNKIIDNLPVYLFVKDVDDDFRYLIWNKSFVEHSKIPAEKVIGRTDFEIFPEYRDALAFRNDDLRVVKMGEMQNKHETYVAADGVTHVVQTYKTLVTRSGRGPLLVGLSLDMTNIKGIEEELIRERLRAEESDRLKSRFLANMSHEIRTPLNAIVGFASMLSDAEDEETRQQFLQIINENTELLLQLINDILDLSKIEAGTLEYIRQPMDLYDMCNNLYTLYLPKMRNGVRLVFDNATAPCRFVVNEDRNRIMQVMDNLLNNAIKFTPQGEIRYGFNINGDWIEMYVSDTGCGIPQDKLETVFERFVKLDNFVQGTGLGLSICRLIVQTLSGQITVKSKEGEGSTFCFTIPLDHNNLHHEFKPAPKKKILKPTHNGNSEATILVAEDVFSNFLIVKTMIKGRYNLLWAHNGIEAVEMAREKTPDLILMDLKMPQMNGIEATEEIRRFAPDVPIVALTANVFDSDRQDAILAGMNNFLSKPLNRDAFEAVLMAYL